MRDGVELRLVQLFEKHGKEYTVDSAPPPGIRGQVSLAISGTYWGGAALGSLVSVALLSEVFVSQFYGWRIAFGIEGLLGVCVLLIRRYVPESPRWLATHGRNDEAEETAGRIEGDVKCQTGREELPPVDEDETITIERRGSIGFGLIARAMFLMYPRRLILGLASWEPRRSSTTPSTSPTA